ncbi:glycosyl hydrolase family 28-related protein [Fibrella aquatilis]|uniref:T9SS type A sorting domain-containing protein n=1 Tax=Fibrella aquatilis TaxID=2817059 RepID=A0A939JYF5_9BACT|nr:glycosyl hydrolase family 28-related protein [Fibrella aquatilis]MBO0933952.1 T9SS type A sorting domain-containing protein [Fibrella aquatilis]
MNPIQRRRLLIALLLIAGLIVSVNGNAQQTYFPSANVFWKNIKTDFGAVGDGVTDDTQAFQRALKSYINPYNSQIAVFVPKGTYLIKDSLRSPNGYYDALLLVQGEDKDQTVIKLADNSPKFQNAGSPLAMFITRGGNQAFGNYFHNLTINTGSGNAGAVGLNYVTSNYGAIRNVKIVSGDGNGYCGISMEQQWPGPGLLKDVTIDRHQFGIRVATCEYSMTFEDVTLTNQKTAGLYNSCNTLSIRKLQSNNQVTAIDNQGRIVLIDSKLNGGLNANAAIKNCTGCLLFARNVETTGYNPAILLGNTPAPTPATITEYLTSANPAAQDYSQFASDGKTLNLPIEETPNYVNNTPADWADVTTYGANPTNPIYAFSDATAGIQAALNSGKKVVYLGKIGDNGTSYCVYADIVVPASVELITGLTLAKFAFYNGSRFVINSNGSAPLHIEGLRNVRVHNNSQRTVVMRSTAESEYTNTAQNTNGKVFIEDAPMPFRPRFPVQFWARQLNPEVQPENEKDLDNNGGKFWILGLKTEGRAVIANTTNGGLTEILGGLVYPASSFSGNQQPAFTINNAQFSLVGVTMTSYVNNGWYGIGAIETQGSVTKSFPASTIWSQTPYNFTFYRSQSANLPVTLISFTARATDTYLATLSWRTTSERNNAYFDVERSPDAQTFVQLGRVNGMGTTTATQTYQFTDEAPPTGVSYYRLKQVDTDGSLTYSPVRAVTINRPDAGLRLLANPVGEQLQVVGLVPQTIMELTDMTGHLYHRQLTTTADTTVDVRTWPAGVYLLRAVDAGGTQTKRVLVSR